MLANAVVALGLAQGPLTLGTGGALLDTPEPLPLGGYTDRRGALAEPGGRPLRASAFAFRQAGTRVVVVVAEMLTIPESLNEEVAARLPKDVHLFLVATHTHSAPDSQMLNRRMTLAIPGIATFRPRWLEWYADRIAVAARQALDSDSPWASGIEVATTRLDLNRGRRPGAVPSSRVVELRMGGVPLLLSYSAHATVLGPEQRQTHGDWPGDLFARRGVGVLPGAIADVSPKGGIAEFRAGFLQARWVVGPLHAMLRWSESPIRLDPASPHPEFAEANGVPQPFAVAAVSRFAPPEARIRAFRIGKLAFVGVPGEPTAEIGRRIEAAGRRLGFDPVVTVSHVGGWIGYILTRSDYARGGYEAQLALHGPGAGDRVVEAARQALINLAL